MRTRPGSGSFSGWTAGRFPEIREDPDKEPPISRPAKGAHPPGIIGGAGSFCVERARPDSSRTPEGGAHGRSRRRTGRIPCPYGGSGRPAALHRGPSLFPGFEACSADSRPSQLAPFLSPIVHSLLEQGHELVKMILSPVLVHTGETGDGRRHAQGGLG